MIFSQPHGPHKNGAVCQVNGCGKAAYARGLCRAHYEQCEERAWVPKEWLRTCAINTCESNELCAPEEKLWIYDLEH